MAHQPKIFDFTGASSIDIREVAFGTGAGITSSDIFTWNNSTLNLMAATGSIFGSNVSKSAIIGGECNTIDNCSINSSIIGGKDNFTECKSYFSSIIGGCHNSMCCSPLSVIIGGASATMSCSSGSVIAGGSGFWGAPSGVTVVALYGLTGGNIISGGKNNFLSGGFSYIKELTPTSWQVYNFPNRVCNSLSSSILGGTLNSLNNANNSSIVAGLSNSITNSCWSSIIGGVGLTLSSESSTVYVPKLKIATASESSATKVLVWRDDKYVGWTSSTSLGGGSGNVAIDKYEVPFGTGTGITSSDTFLYYDNATFSQGGKLNNVLILGNTQSDVSKITSTFSDTYNKSLIIGKNFKYVETFTSSSGTQSYNLLLIGPSHSHSWSDNSIVIGGECNSLIGTSTYINTRSAIIAGLSNSITCQSKDSIIIGGYSNRNGYGSCESSIIGGSSNLIDILSCRSSIIGGSKNTVTLQSSRSSVVTGCCNCVRNSISSSIIAGYKNYIGSSVRASIIGGCGNTIKSGNDSVIVGGSSLYLANSCTALVNRLEINYSMPLPVGSSQSKILVWDQSLSNCRRVNYREFNELLSSSTASVQPGVTGSVPYYFNGSWTWSNTNIYNNGSRVGIGGTGSTASSDLHVFGSLSLDLATTSSATYTLTENNFTLLVYTPNGGATVSLPSATSARHRVYVIKKVDSSTSSIVNVRPNAGDNIEGWTGNITLDYPYDYYMLQSNGQNMWIKLGGAGGLNL